MTRRVAVCLALVLPGACGPARACTVDWASHGGDTQLVASGGDFAWLDAKTLSAQTGCATAAVRATQPTWLPYTLAVLKVEDYRLRRGVSLGLARGADKPAFSLALPPKKVFLPFPYHVPFATGGVDPVTWQDGPLLVRVLPRITKKADVNVRNSAEYGLIARVDYKGAGFFEIRDGLGRLNRRDMSFGVERQLLGNDTLLQVENAFETYLERRFSVITHRSLGGLGKVKLRADNLFAKAPTKLGANLTAGDEKLSLEVGNVGLRRVEENNHAQLQAVLRAVTLQLRAEGVGMGGNGDAPWVARDRRHGAAVHVTAPGGWAQLSLGNLNMEDVDEEGTVDNRVHQRLTLNLPFGREAFFSTQPWNLQGVLRPGLAGVGQQRWGRSHAQVDLSYRRKHVLRLRYDDDYARFQGRERKPYWRTTGVSLNSFRDLFSRDRLTRWGLDSVYVDYESTLRTKGGKLSGEWRVGASRLLTWRDYDLPLEFGLKFSNEQWKPEIRFSIREYL